MNRNGEKIGWIGGWIGSFLWLLALSVLWFFRGQIQLGEIAIGLFILAVIVVNLVTPWRYPDTKYWKLMLFSFITFIMSIIICVTLGIGVKDLGFRWSDIFWFVPMLTPFYIFGNRTWNDGNSS
jgi:hypothetical protein